jgi:hypothetical protein
MNLPIKIYSQFDVVVVSFPFADSSVVKRSPALIVVNITTSSLSNSFVNGTRL